MNRKTLFCLLAVTFVAVFALAACSRGAGDGAESDTTTAAATTLPRYDYFEADVADDVVLDEAHYTDVTLSISNSLRVDDEDVAGYMDDIRFQYRTAENGSTKVTDKAIKIGDDAFIYYRGYLDGEEFEGGSNWNDTSAYELGIGSGDFIPGFEEGLVGVVPNTTSRETPFELSVSFPEDYHAESLAGKAVVFHVYIEASIQYTVPEYTRDFILNTLEYETQKSFYASDSALLTEFKAAVREQMEDSMAEKVNIAKVDAMFTYLVEKATFKSLPEEEVNFYFISYKSQMESYYNYYAASESFVANYPTMDSFAVVYFGFGADADWQAELLALCERTVKKDMVTHAIAERMGLETITDAEYKAQVDYWASYYQGYMAAEDVEKNLGKAYLMEGALAEKMQKLLLERFVFVYEDGTPVGGTATETETEAETEAQTIS